MYQYIWVIHSLRKVWGEGQKIVANRNLEENHISLNMSIQVLQTSWINMHHTGSMYGTFTYIHFMIFMANYCWWLKSCTTWDVWNPVNNGKNYQPQLVLAGFQPSTVVKYTSPMDPSWDKFQRQHFFQLQSISISCYHPLGAPWQNTVVLWHTHRENGGGPLGWRSPSCLTPPC